MKGLEAIKALAEGKRLKKGDFTYKIEKAGEFFVCIAKSDLLPTDPFIYTSLSSIELNAEYEVTND